MVKIHYQSNNNQVNRNGTKINQIMIIKVVAIVKVNNCRQKVAVIVKVSSQKVKISQKVYPQRAKKLVNLQYLLDLLNNHLDFIQDKANLYQFNNKIINISLKMRAYTRT